MSIITRPAGARPPLTRDDKELDALPGVRVRPAARLVVDYRQKNGPFKKFEDLRGVGVYCSLLAPWARLSPTTAGVKDPKATARTLVVLFDGAVAGSEVDGPQRASDARWMAKKLLAG